jgi:hypothetical protein
MEGSEYGIVQNIQWGGLQKDGILIKFLKNQVTQQ